MPTFEANPAQQASYGMLTGPAKHQGLEGGSRSGKTFWFLRSIIIRAMKASRSRHAVLRYRFNHVKASVVLQTWPDVLARCFPRMRVVLNRTDWYATLPNGSEVWFGGLDDKERTEKILGQEYATVFLNECSQISYDARNMLLTRLAQKAICDGGVHDGEPLSLRAYYDLNPPSKGHWSYKLFHLGIEPTTRRALPNREEYAVQRMNPRDNVVNLGADYLQTLEALPPHLRLRFLDGEYSDENPHALFSDTTIATWRQFGDLPDMVRIIVGVDPSGADDDSEGTHDDIGIVVGGLGTDGNAYLLEDITVQAGPGTWGKMATDAYERHAADLIVAEDNFGGAMVKHVIQTARPKTPYRAVKASRGKVVRAEPYSALYEQGKVRHVGEFRDLEAELCAFSTAGYTGEGSPNRADAWIWVLTELFPGLVAEPKKKREQTPRSHRYVPEGGWMAA